MVWISTHPPATPEAFCRIQGHVHSVNGFSLCFVYAGIVMLVAEVVPLFWQQTTMPNVKVTSFGEIAHVFSWHMAYGLTIVRIALFATQQYNSIMQGDLDTAYLIDMQNKLTVLAFFVGILLLLPYWRQNVCLYLRYGTASIS